MKYEGKVWSNGGWVDREIQPVRPKLKPLGKRRICGVYAIECHEKKLAYIGQSINIKARWSQHRHVLRMGTCEIKEMQALWNENQDCFEFKILEETDQELRIKEQSYAEEYIKKGYTLFNSYFILNPTNLVFSDDFKPLFIKIMKLHAKGRLNISELERHLDNL